MPICGRSADVFFLLCAAGCGKSDAAGIDEPTEEVAETTEQAEPATKEEPAETVAPSAGEKKTDSQDLSTISKGKLTVAACTDMYPYEFYPNGTDSPELTGIEVSLVKYIAGKLGLELELLPLEASEAMNTISKGRRTSRFWPFPRRP